MRKWIVIVVLSVFLLPLATHGIWWQMREHPRSWAVADWSSAGILPAPQADKGAAVYVMAGRTGRWKGIFAHHMWLVTKARDGKRYRRYEVVGWGRALRVDLRAPDGRWYGNDPSIILALKGEQAERALPRIARAIAAYPYGGRSVYSVWPGPNSNTFIAHVARQVPELAVALVPTAIGKDYARWPGYVGWSPSRTGVQLSLGGVLGVTVGWVEGVEVNLFGLVAGIDVRSPALKIPGWGRIDLNLAAVRRSLHGAL
ncbi:MAG: DUF3750 domain-containing protein [Hyphomicrobiaceae bacterium]